MAGSKVEEPLILASASPRRAELLTQIGVRFRVVPSNFDETIEPGEGPDLYVRRMARGKATDVVERLGGESVVLGADTVVVLDDRILGKPTSTQAAQDMLSQLSGRGHQVMSAVTVVANSAVEGALSVTDVWFRALKASEIERYVALGEGSDKAGGYAIQGFGAVFVDRIRGSYSGVSVCRWRQRIGC